MKLYPPSFHSGFNEVSNFTSAALSHNRKIPRKIGGSWVLFGADLIKKMTKNRIFD
jgi:hypothetical protein